VPEHGERVRLDTGEMGIYLVCVDCGAVRKQRYKSPPFAERCAKCHRVRYAGTLGDLTIPENERINRRRVKGRYMGVRGG